MKYKFEVKIKLSHFKEAKNFFNSMNKHMEEFTGEKHNFDAVGTLGTITMTSKKKMTPEELETIRKTLEKQTRTQTKNEDIKIVLQE